jgi:hypothetical protein
MRESLAKKKLLRILLDPLRLTGKPVSLFHFVGYF